MPELVDAFKNVHPQNNSHNAQIIEALNAALLERRASA